MSDAGVIDALLATVGTPEGLYGRRKMTALLARRGLPVSHHTVDRLMRDLQLNGVRRAGRLLQPAVLKTRRKDGCIQFLFLRTIGEPDNYVIFGRWHNKRSLQAHFRQDYFAAVIDVFTGIPAFGDRLSFFLF